MAFTVWLTLRQVKEALRSGRPEDAHRLLDPLVADGHRKAFRLLAEVARSYVARGERHLRADSPEAAWKELLAAEALNTGEPRAAALRQALTRLGLAEARAALEAGRPRHVIETVARLRDRNCRQPELDGLEDAAHDWLLAAEMADRGDFALAIGTAERLRRRIVQCPTTGLDQFLRQLADRHERFRDAVGRLTDAAEGRHWREAARCADDVIAVAPNHREARQVQLRAWESLQPLTASYHSNGTDSAVVPLMASAGATADTRPAPPPGASGRPSGAVDLHDGRPDPARGHSSAGPLPKRFLLWVDGVGGYLVCLSGRVTFGQATADGPIDVPLFADVSRLHAEVTRDGEGYLLESTRGVQVNGAATDKAVLRCGDRVTLGATCQFLFRQPVPVSPSARLELVSGHRLPLAVDGVLLMADNLILGPGPQAHVTLPWVPGNVILYRSKDGLGVRFDGRFAVDNRACQGRATLPLPAAVSADTFSFALEPVGSRL
jgi:tetratricopeptide (TPR) repeat protein